MMNLCYNFIGRELVQICWNICSYTGVGNAHIKKENQNSYDKLTSYLALYIPYTIVYCHFHVI